MDLNVILGSLQIALSVFQLKLDHFSRSTNRLEENEMNSFYDLGEAIRKLEFALAETVSFIEPTDDRNPNARLASLWEDASSSIRKIKNGADLADLTFEKHLYWRNPGFYKGQDEYRLYRISLNNVIAQLSRLRTTYDRLQQRVKG